MKLRILFWVVVPLLVGVATYFVTSGSLRRPWAVLTGSAPVLECPETLVIGERELGETVVAHFSIANSGGGELVIDQIRTNCACSGLEEERGDKLFRVEELRLRRGQRVRVALRVAVQGEAGGPVRNVVLFRTNDPIRREVVIEAVIPKVTAGVTASPKCVLFGSVPVGNEARQFLEVRDDGLPRRTIERVESSDTERIAVRLVPRNSSPSGVGDPGSLIGQVEVICRSREPGAIAGHIAIHFSGAVRPPVFIPVNGRVAATVEVSPFALVLPLASNSGPIYHGKCRCRSSKGDPLKLSLVAVPEGLSARVTPIKGRPDMVTVHIEWNPATSTRVKQEGRDWYACKGSRATNR